MKWIKIFIVIMLICIFPLKIYATECTESDRTYLNSLFENIKLDYEHVEPNNEIKGITDNYFKIKITNLPKEIIAYNNYDEKSYINNTDESLSLVETDNVLGGNKVVFSFETSEVANCTMYLGTKSISIPFYNSYKDDELCLTKKDSYYCQEFLNERISYEEFKDGINKYQEEITTEVKNEDNIDKSKKDVSVTKTILIISSIFVILIIIITIIIIINKKRR